MKKIIVASKNPVKLKAALIGFSKMFPKEKFVIEAVSAPSGVSDQPQNEAEALQGAINRIKIIQRANPKADFYVGMEGGIEEKHGGMEAYAWIVIKSREGVVGKGKTCTIYLPEKIRQLIKKGKELGEADDIVFGQKNSKQKNGAVGILTGNIITRTKSYAEAVVCALIPFKNKKLYS
ncbi:MAG: putative inosine/xanthosine triphosphatase [Parcubacteria group bacterium Athens0714_26]|nr:MAG: putative inosine/xanthosine triphosphatase [Parcubacteria group bacterium Athens0714_26]